MRPITASDVMNPRVLTVRDDLTVRELANFLVANEISGAPVEDGAGKLVGVVSLTDVAAAFAGADAGDERDDDAGDEGEDDEDERADFFVSEWEDGSRREEVAGLDLEAAELTVREILTPDLYTVRDDTPVSEIAELMIESHIHRLLVTREDRVVGIISTSDLLGLLVEDKE